MDTAQISETLSQHQTWLESEKSEGTQAVFEGADLEGADFKKANLREANFRKANLKQADLQAADLTGADLKGAILDGTDFTGAILDGTNVRGTLLEKEERRRDREIFQKRRKDERELGREMRRKDQELKQQRHLRAKNEKALSMMLPRHKLWLESQGKEGQQATLEGVSLNRVNLKGANLERAILKRANLEEANLEGANLEGADLRMANLERANLVGANLSGSDLRLASLEGINLEGANLKKANLGMANFADPCLKSRKDSFVVPPNSNLKNANLEEANCRSADLSFTYLAEANLKAAVLEESDLERANLKGAFLENANLGGAKLTDAILENVSLQGATLDRQHLAETSFEGIDLEGTEIGERAPEPARKPTKKTSGTSVTENLFVSCFANVNQGRRNTVVFQCWIHNHPHLEEVMGRAEKNKRKKVKPGFPASESSLISLEFLPHHLRSASGVFSGRTKILKHVWWRGKPTFAEFTLWLPRKPVFPIRESINIYIEDEIAGRCAIEMNDETAEGFTSRCEFFNRIFVSFSRDDKKGLQPGFRKLRSNGKKLYLDSAKLAAGDDWEERLETELTKRDALFFYWSKHAAQSERMALEWKVAMRERGPDFIWPQPMDEVPLPGKLLKTRELREKCNTLDEIRKMKRLHESFIPG